MTNKYKPSVIFFGPALAFSLDRRYTLCIHPLRGVIYRIIKLKTKNRGKFTRTERPDDHPEYTSPRRVGTSQIQNEKQKRIQVMLDKSIKSKKFLDKGVGIQGEERDILMAKIYMGKGGASLATALKNGGKAGASLGTEIEDLMGLQRGALKKPFHIVKNFVQPPDNTWIEVGFGCLCGTGEEKLFAFIPHLRKHYANLAKGLTSPIWITYWSIEVEIPSHHGGRAWWDLRELTVDQIENLEHLMAHGIESAGNVPVAVDTAAAMHAVPQDLSPQDMLTTFSDEMDFSSMTAENFGL